LEGRAFVSYDQKTGREFPALDRPDQVKGTVPFKFFVGFFEMLQE
jgi:hypothetical protein